MARLKDTFTRSDLFNVPVDSIAVDEGFNVRIDTPDSLEDDEALCQSILDNGFYRHRPLTIRQSPTQDGKAVLVDGHRRFKAVLEAISRGAEIKTLPCMAEGQGVSDADRILMLFTSNSGRPLTAMEQATVIKRLLSYGWSEVEIASKIGRTRQTVTNLLDIAAAPHDVVESIKCGEIKATEAVKLIRDEGPNGVSAFIKEARNHTSQEGAKAGRITASVITKTRAAKNAKTIKAVVDTSDYDIEAVPVVARRVINLWFNLVDAQPEVVEGLPKAFTTALEQLRDTL